MIIVLVAIAVITASFLCEYIDSSLGMGYGSILSPALIIMGYNPLIVVPSILISQTTGSIFASCFHHRFKNMSFKAKSMDAKIFLAMTVPGIIASVTGAYISVSIPAVIIKLYIGLLVACMGLLLLRGLAIKFTWPKLMFIGILSSMNKAVTGGGFGPLLTSGQIISGREPKNSVGVTTAVQVPVSLSGFAAYLFFTGGISWELPLLLTAGALLATPFGPKKTSTMNHPEIKKYIGTFMIILGTLTVIKVF